MKLIDPLRTKWIGDKVLLSSVLISKCFISTILILAFSIAEPSDHGDGHIGDLYAFEFGGKLVLAMTIRSDIPTDYNAFRFPKNVTYQFLIDRDAEIRGNVITKPESIHEDIVIEVAFPNEDGKPMLSVSGISMDNGTAASSVLLFTGVRDEPFIRRGLEGKNIAAVVVELPIHSLVSTKPLLIWATTLNEKREMIDLCGNPYRSQLRGNEKLNTTHPSEHTKLPGIQAPDVTIYDISHPAKYPNGRQLEDDVVDILNLQDQLPGEQPSPNKNDVPFLKRFPYLAPPHDKEHSDFEANAPKEHVGMHRRELGKFDLGREFPALGGRDLRLRYWLMDSGGIIRFHKHAERPAIVYLLSGSVEEFKWGVTGSRTIKAGEATREAADTEHYWINKGKESVRMAAIDLVELAEEMSVAGSPQPVPRGDIDLAKVEADMKSKFKIAEYKLLEEIQLRESFPQITDAYNYVMRGREITVKPNEMIPLQKHAERPSIVYVIQGAILEYRNDREDKEPVPLRAGDVTINTNGISRLLVNTSDQDVKLFEVDLFDSAKIVSN